MLTNQIVAPTPSPPLAARNDSSTLVPEPAYTQAMTGQTAKLLQQALELSEEERAKLAHALLDNVNPFQDKAIEEAWNEETGGRINELDSGRAKTVPWEEVKARLQQKLR